MGNMLRTVSAAVMIAIAGCAGPSYTVEMEASGTKVLKGYFHRQDLERDSLFSWFGTNYHAYPVDSATVSALTPLMDDVHFVVVLGTWCGDSKREVPHCCRVFDAAGVKESAVKYFGVDRTKKSGDGTTDKYNVARVPTIIVFRGDQELGRIVEHPRETPEKDLLRLLQR